MKQMNVIRSLSNTQMKNLIQLQKKSKTREEQGIFVIEGLKMFEEAKEAGDLLVKVYASESFFYLKMGENPNYFQGLDYEVITDSVFHQVAETKTPQGIMATVKVITYSLEDILYKPNCSLLVLEDIRDPGNLGTIIRTAEGAGITGVIMNSSCVDIYNPKVIRSTMGSIFRVPFIQIKDLLRVLQQIKKQQIHIYAAHLDGKVYDLEEGFKEKCALLIGNEANGLSTEVSTTADSLIKIPMAGKVESLNASVAAAILMYEIARQRRS